MKDRNTDTSDFLRDAWEADRHQEPLWLRLMPYAIQIALSLLFIGLIVGLSHARKQEFMSFCMEENSRAQCEIIWRAGGKR